MIQALRKSIAVVTAIVLLAAWPAVVGVPVARAQLGSLDFQLWEALITQVDPSSRTVSLWEYLSGRRRSGLQVEGTVDLHHFKVGDYVLARIGVENDLVTEIRSISPPTGDKRYEDALRYVLGQEHK
ncbi:MAG: hypothetical protein ACE5NA_10995 [Nitrospiraceae bacterium]